MNSKPPAFQFYPKDFLSDEHVMVMLPSEIGFYVILLCVDWLEGSIPDDPERIARICRVSTDEIRQAWPNLNPCFQNVPGEPGRLTNPRLQKEREAQESFRKRQVKNGSLGGRPARKTRSNPPQRIDTNGNKPRPFQNETQAEPTGLEVANPNETSSSPSPSASSTAIQNTPTPLLNLGPKHNGFYADEGWLEFQRAFPNDKRIFEASSYYAERIRGSADPAAEHARIIAGCGRAARFYRETRTTPEFQANAVEFLRGSRYLEEWKVENQPARRRPSEIVRDSEAEKIRLQVLSERGQ